jgi:hypothetical protein
MENERHLAGDLNDETEETSRDLNERNDETSSSLR